MATTANRGYPYPVGTDQPNGPVQFQALANAVDADVTLLAALGSSVHLVSGNNFNIIAAGNTGNPRSMFGANMYTTSRVTGTALTAASVTTGAGGQITAGRAGVYRWSASMQWQSITGTARGVAFLQVNGTAVPNDAGTVDTLISSTPLRITPGDLVELNAGDVVNFAISHTSSSNVPVTLNAFGLEYVGS